jgi:nucleoid-associated protein YgaU
MIRIVLITAGFIGITVALIMMQPSNPRQVASAAPETAEPDPTVTRQNTDFQALTQLGAAPENDTAPATREPALAVTPQPAPKLSSEANLETMILGVLKQGQSEEYIEALITDAAENGKITVPDSLITSDGRVDTSALLATLSQPTAPARHTHTVSPGDTLASISYRYYGRTEHGPAIMAANADTLPAESHLSVGQSLVIPKLQ